MGAGWGTGKGKGKGVKGGWRVNAFLLLLTGWQAVLLPWSPLILKDAGFSASSVGMLSGGTTMVASLSVVMCLRWMSRNRSGALRRLLLWLMIAAATILQGWGVGLELRHLSQGGAMPSCVRGWIFSPPKPVFHMNNVSISTTTHVPEMVPQQHHGSSILATTTQSPSTSPHPPNTSRPPHNNSNPPSLPNHTTSITTPLPITTATSSFIPPTSLMPTKINATTPAPAANISIITTPVTSILVHPTLPPTKNSTKKTNEEIANSKVDTSETLPERLPVDQGKYQNHTHESLIPARNGTQQEHNYKYLNSFNVRPKSSEGVKKPKKTSHINPKNTQPSNSNDDLISPENLKDDDYIYLKDDEQDASREDTKEGDDIDYNDDSQKMFAYYPTSNSQYSSSFDKRPHFDENMLPETPKRKDFLNYPLNTLNPKMPAKYFQALRKSTFLNPLHHDLLTTSRKSKEMLLQNEQDLPPSSSHRQHIKHPIVPIKETHYSYHPSQQIKDASNDKSHYDYNNYHKTRPQHDFHRRNRRDLAKKEGKAHIHPVRVKTNASKTQPDEGSENQGYPTEEMKSEIIKVGIAVLLMLGGLAGAGVEAGVAQLWHCFIHGYDESGESQDVLQRTITHTFHLSTYGNHKTWTGITSGGWVIGAGVVSILACLAGTGGGGYGGLLGVHLTLAIGALLLLLVLPVPYGSIDPPKTRRPLSLYLDDEVLREGVRRLSFHIWVFMNGSLAALSLTFSLWLLQEMTTEGWLVGSQAGAVTITLVSESLALHTQRRLVIRWGLHGLMSVCGVSLVLHYGIMWASTSVGVVVSAHAGLGVAMAFLWVAVKHNALLLATISDQEREAWASWWCWRLGLGVGAAVWGVGLVGTSEEVRPLLVLATIGSAILASSLCVTAVLSRRSSRSRRRVYHTLDLDIVNDEIDEDDDASEDDWLVKRAKKEGISL